MPSKKNRVMLTMPDDLDAIFSRIAELENKPKTKVIIDYLAAMKPHAESMIHALELVQQKKNPLLVLNQMAANSLTMLGTEMSDFFQLMQQKQKEHEDRIAQESKND